MLGGVVLELVRVEVGARSGTCWLRWESGAYLELKKMELVSQREKAWQWPVSKALGTSKGPGPGQLLVSLWGKGLTGAG